MKTICKNKIAVLSKTYFASFHIDTFLHKMESEYGFDGLKGSGLKSYAGIPVNVAVLGKRNRFNQLVFPKVIRFFLLSLVKYITGLNFVLIRNMAVHACCLTQKGLMVVEAEVAGYVFPGREHVKWCWVKGFLAFV